VLVPKDGLAKKRFAQYWRRRGGIPDEPSTGAAMSVA